MRGEIQGADVYADAVSAGLEDVLVSQFAATLARDVDFQRDLRPGDVFEAVFERKAATAKTRPTSRLLYVGLRTRAQASAFYAFKAPGATQPDWYDGAGLSAERELLRTPIDGARVSSTFGPRRHPILGYTRLHQGLDFAAPVGSAIYAAGAGVVEAAGARGTAGLYVRLRHANDLRTSYAHLSTISPDVTPGAIVHQGQQIGLSGDTGLSTGPHLHYEVSLAGVAVDPATVRGVSGADLPAPMRQAFRQQRDAIDRRRTGINQ